MADDTKSRLLDAAIEVFSEKGYQGAGVAEIARRAELTTGAIYSQYRGKADLLLEALTARIPDELDRLLASGDAPADVPSILSVLGSGLLEHADGDALMLETFAAGRRESELGERLRHRLEDEERQMSKLIEEAKADGLFDPLLDTDAVVRLCHSIGLGMFLSRAIGLPMPDPSHWRLVIDRVIASAAPGGGAPSQDLAPTSTSTTATSPAADEQPKE